MKTKHKIHIIAISFITIAMCLIILSGCKDTNDTQPSAQKPPIKVEVYIQGNFIKYELTRTSGSEVKKFIPGDKIPMRQGDKLYTYLGLPNNEQGTINYYQVTDSTRVLLSGLSRQGQFSLEFNY